MQESSFFMDKQQEEMQFLGLFGIFAESFKLIFIWRKIFSQITITLILPLSFIFLTQDEISSIFNHRITSTENMLHLTQEWTPRHRSLSNLLTSERVIYILFQTLYITSLLIFSLLSTSAVVYTVACVYTSREITFKKVMSVVPKVWKTLMVTFLCTFLGFFAYNIIFVLAFFLWFMTISDTPMLGGIVFGIILTSYPIGFIYMTIIWQLASVVTVLEDSYGVKAMIKSKDLIKGKILIALVIFLMLNVSLAFIASSFRGYVVYRRREVGTMQIIGMGILCLLLLLKLILFALVVQTVIYFVCKSYHHENIDKSALSDHLEVYLGDYVPLKAKDVQLEEYHV